MDELTPTEVQPEIATSAAASAVEPEQTSAVEPAEGASSAPEPVELEYPEDEPADGGPEKAGEDKAVAEPAPAAEDAQPGSQRFGTSALTRLLRDNPELDQAAAANPRIKAQLYQMARRSQELAQYQELVPSLSRAREAVEKAQAIDGFDQSFFGGQPEQFWRGLYDAAAGSGAYERNVQFLQQAFLDGVAGRAVQAGNPGLKEAVKTIREALGWGANGRKSPVSQAEDGGSPHNMSEQDLSPHIRQQLQELEQLRRRRSEEEKQAHEKFWDETAQEAGREIRGFVEGILAQARLSDYDKQNIVRDFLEDVARLADEDKVHNAALDDLFRQGGATPATRAQMIARVKQWARQNGRDILEPILRKAGAGLKQRQQQREAAAAKARVEPQAGGTPSPPLQATARDLVHQAEQKLGRRLSDREILELG